MPRLLRELLAQWRRSQRVYVVAYWVWDDDEKRLRPLK